MMGRDTNYANLESRGYTTLKNQPTANEYQVPDNGRNAHKRSEYIPTGEYRADYKSTAAVPYPYSHNASGYNHQEPGYIGVNVYRKTKVFDDCETFTKELSSDILGRIELEKFERNPYRSRYLNTPECEILLTTNCQRLLHTYYSRADTLASNVSACGLSRVTFEEIAGSGLTSTDHLTNLITLGILARYHKVGYLIPQLLDSNGTNAHLVHHVLNVIRIVYSAAYNYGGAKDMLKWSSIDIAKRFYSLMKKGAWKSVAEDGDPFSSLDIRVAQRICLLYGLCLHLLDVMLGNASDIEELQLDTNGDLYSTIVCVACCFVEQEVRHKDAMGYGIADVDMPEDRMAPDIQDQNAIFSKHWSVVNGFLSCGVKLENSDLLEKGVKALCNILESKNRGRSLLLWAYCVYVRLCPTELSANNYSIPRILFEYMSKCRSVLQLKAIINALAVCMKDLGFARYADERMNPQKTFATFVLHPCNLIHNKMDDLAVPILQMLYLLFDICPKTLQHIANAMSGIAGLLERYSDTVGNAVETFLNVAILSIGEIQIIMALVMRRVLMRADVSKSLNAELRAKFVRHLLTIVGFKKPARETPIDPIGLLSKVAMIEAFVQAGGLSELIGVMKEVNAKQLRLVAMHVSSVSPEFLYKALCTGDIATKLVAYDTLSGYRPDSMDCGTFMLCAICSAVKMCPSISGFMREYASAYSSMTEYHATGTFVTEGKFLRAISPDSSPADPTRNFKVAALLSVHAVVASIHMSSEPTKQSLIHTLLCPEGKGNQEFQGLVAKYEAQLASQRKELARSKARLDAQVKDFEQQKASSAKQMELIKNELTSKVDRSRAELEAVQGQLTAAQSQVQQLERECSKLRTQVTDLEQAMRQVSAERAQISESLREAHLHRDRLKSEVSNLKSQIEQRDASIAQLRKVESDNVHLSQEANEVKAQVERVYRMLISLMYKHNELEGELLHTREERDKTTQHLRERQTQVEELSNKCRSLDNNINSMRVAKEAAESEIQRLTRHIQTLGAKLHQTTEDMGVLQTRHNQTSQALKDSEEQRRCVSEQLKQCEAQLRMRGEHLSTIYSTFQDKPY